MMYYRKSLDGKNFVYFWSSKTTVVNNNKRSGQIFGNPFSVTPENCIEWRESSRPDMIAPELLTYWSE